MRIDSWRLRIVACAEFKAGCVKHENFKTCDQSGFCKRNRAFADSVAASGTAWTSPYTLLPNTVRIKNGYVRGTILKSLGDGQPSIDLPLLIHFQEPGVSRIIIDEAKRQKGDIELRHNSQARKERYNEVDKWALVGHSKSDPGMKGESTEKETVVTYGPENKYRAIIRHSPFSIDFIRDEQVQVKFNGHGLLNMEHWRPKVEKEKKEGEEVKEGGEANEEEGEDESTWWEESFGGNTDTKPKGPESVAMDITFPEYEHVYGIPGHAGPLALKETR